MMKHGDKTKIMWYNLTNPIDWEIEVSDGLYGRHSIWQDNTTYNAQINPSTPLIAVPRSNFLTIAKIWRENFENPNNIFCTQ